MSQNPYATDPAANSYASVPGLPGQMVPGQILGVDGKFLVVRSGAVLPAICVRTGEPVSAKEMKSTTLFWCSPFIYLLLLINLLVLLIVYLIVRKPCKITYGLSRGVRTKTWILVLVKAVITCALLVATLGALIFEAPPVVGGILALCTLIGFFVTCLGNSALTARKHKDGSFWIKGLSQEAMSKIASQI